MTAGQHVLRNASICVRVHLNLRITLGLFCVVCFLFEASFLLNYLNDLEWTAAIFELSWRHLNR